MSQNTNLHQHVHLCAQHHDLQRHSSNIFFVWFGDVFRETEAIYLLIGVTIQIKNSATSLCRKTRIIYKANQRQVSEAVLYGVCPL